MPLNHDYDKAKDMNERAMENVFIKVDVAKAYLEQLSFELYGVEMSEEEWRKIDSLLSKAIVKLEGI